MDHFRRLNEQLGHRRGDLVLVHLARVISDRVRASDLVVRMGGEEFGVLLRSCGPADASTVAEKIREALATNPAVIDRSEATVRVSVGIAGYPDHAIDTRDLVLAAERALRHAKETGRDRVSIVC